MREHAPVCWHPPGELPGFWSVTRYEDVRTVYGNPQLFSSAHGVLLRPTELGDDPGGGLTLALSDPPRHGEFRSVLASSFNRRSVRELENAMRETVRRLIGEALARGECDFAQDIATLLAMSILCGLLGSPADDHEKLLGWTNEVFAAGRPLTGHQQLMRYFIDLMYARMANPEQDLMSMLAIGTVEGELLLEQEILLTSKTWSGPRRTPGYQLPVACSPSLSSQTSGGACGRTGRCCRRRLRRSYAGPAPRRTACGP